LTIFNERGIFEIERGYSAYAYPRRSIMVNVFNYIDYREFLEDFIAEKKQANAHFSYQVLASQAGFRSKSFIKMVVDGQKNLSDESITQLNRVLKLAEKPFAYFKDLVAFNQAKSIHVRNYCFEKLLDHQKRGAARLILQNQYDLLSAWYHGTLREIVTKVDFKEDYAFLGSLVKPAISARKARKAIALLLKLGVIRKTAAGFEQTDSSLTTGDEIRSLAATNFHIQNLNLAGASIDACNSAERDISCIIAGMSQTGFEQVKKEIQAFRKRLMKIIENEKRVERVFHINFQLFPTSERIHEST
jgi:uncharacterized protein (TIGR02147 family)